MKNLDVLLDNVQKELGEKMCTLNSLELERDKILNSYKEVNTINQQNKIHKQMQKSMAKYDKLLNDITQLQQKVRSIKEKNK